MQSKKALGHGGGLNPGAYDFGDRANYDSEQPQVSVDFRTDVEPFLIFVDLFPDDVSPPLFTRNGMPYRKRMITPTSGTSKPT